MKKLLPTVLVVLLLGAGAVEAAAAKRAPGKTAGKSSSVKRTSSSATTKSSARKRTASKRRSSTRRTRSARPSRPSPERYKEFQQALADKGFYDGPINGVWTAECIEAVKKFQESENLTVDGKLGARSIIALGLGPQRSADTQFLVKPSASDSDEEP